MLAEIKGWITNSGCISYADLCRYARTERPDWMPVIRKKTISILKMLQIFRFGGDPARGGGVTAYAYFSSFTRCGIKGG